MFDFLLILALLSSTIITSNSRNMPGSKCVPEPKSMRMQLLVLRLTRIFSSFMSRCSTFLFLRVFTADNIYQKYFITHFRTRQKLLSNYDQTCLKNFWAVASSSDPFSVMKSNKSWKNIYRYMWKNIFNKYNSPCSRRVCWGWGWSCRVSRRSRVAWWPIRDGYRGHVTALHQSGLTWWRAACGPRVSAGRSPAARSPPAPSTTAAPA